MKREEKGAISISVIIAVTMSLLFVITLIFAIIAYAGQQDYKNNAQEKIDAAVAVAKKETETADDNKYAELAKSPVKTFSGSPTFGTVSFDYPKTYSGYSIESTSGGLPIDAYFQRNIVPSINSATNVFALRLQVVANSYANAVKEFEAKAKNGKVTVSAFRAAKVPDTLGVRVDGEILTGKQGSMILLPLRDKTIKIWTESIEDRADFNTFVVPSISFIP